MLISFEPRFVNCFLKWGLNLMRAKVVSTLLHELAVEFRKVLKQAENSKKEA